jgi:hypothetical protein
LLGRAGLSQGEDTAPNRYLSPQAEFRFSSAERASRVHDEDTIRRQPVDLSVFLPFRRFLLQTTVQGYAQNMGAHTLLQSAK